MIKALVLGATGSIGIHVTLELAKKGIEVVAFSRSRQKMEFHFQSIPNVTICQGDVLNHDELLEASRGIDIIYHAINIPYPEWENKLPVVMKNVITAAAMNGSKLVYVDNIYAYGKNPGYPIDETQPKRPHTRKGKIRLALEQTIHLAHSQSTPAMIVHFPDFYGPYAGNTMLNTTFEPLAKGKKAVFVGDKSVKREYIYLPDAAKALVNLSMQEKCYGQNWNIPGSGLITGKEILKVAEKVLQRKCKALTVGKGIMFIAGIFNRFMYEVREMLYLTENPVVLDGSKYTREIGPVPATPYDIGIQTTLESLSRS